MPDVSEMNKISDSSEGMHDTNKKESNEYSMIYRAKCVDNKDPLKSGRIKVNIPKLNSTTTEDTEGTWAYPCTPFAGSNLEGDAEESVHDFGSLCIPPKDSVVYVFFEEGDQSKPRYFGGLVTEGAVPTENQQGEEYYNKHTIFKSPKKRLIFISDDSKTDACILIRGMERS